MDDLIDTLQAIGLNPIVIETAKGVTKLPQVLPAADMTQPLDLDDIRKRVMADQPITLEEEKLLLGSIRRGYSMQLAPTVKVTKSAAAPRGVAKSATGKQSTGEQFAALGGLDVL